MEALTRRSTQITNLQSEVDKSGAGSTSVAEILNSPIGFGH